MKSLKVILFFLIFFVPNMHINCEYLTRKERAARKDFFYSYSMLNRKVNFLLRKNLEGRTGYGNVRKKKASFLNIGGYGYIDFITFSQYMKFFKLKGLNIGKEDKTKITSRKKVLFGGAVVNMNFLNDFGISVIGGYSLTRVTQADNTIGFGAGWSVVAYIRFIPKWIVSGIIFDLIPSLLDPVSWILGIFGWCEKKETLIGFKFDLWNNVSNGSLKPGARNMNVKDLIGYWKDKNKKTVDKVLFTMTNVCELSRRVYINEHVFYSLHTELLIPIIIKSLAYDCKKVCDWVKVEWPKGLIRLEFGAMA